jgi:GDPmannose 4,6-dehydratase
MSLAGGRYTPPVSSRSALITGIAGQDGSFLAESLVQEGVHVVGVERPGRVAGASNLSAVEERIRLMSIDLADVSEVRALVGDLQPTWIFHLAGSSFVPASWAEAGETIAFASTATASLLDAIRDVSRATRFFNASSAEIFGRGTTHVPDETTCARPDSPYGAAKAVSLHLTRMYRERFGLCASTGILYNHESHRRPLEFVSRKITHAAASISLGLQSELRLGNLDARRDWSCASDFVQGMRLIVDAPNPGEFVLASGESRSVREFLDAAFGCVGIDWRQHVVVDDEFARPNDIANVVGNPTKAERDLGWRRERGFSDWVAEMVECDLVALRNG